MVDTKLIDLTPASPLDGAELLYLVQDGNDVKATVQEVIDLVNVPVTSVNSLVGDVVLTKSDIGLDNVDNTSDLNKLISIATQAALDTKASQDFTIAMAVAL
jgi:hypothetical protein